MLQINAHEINQKGRKCMFTVLDEYDDDNVILQFFSSIIINRHEERFDGEGIRWR